MIKSGIDLSRSDDRMLVDLTPQRQESVSQYLSRILSLIPQDCSAVGLDLIYDRVDDMLSAGEFAQVNDLFTALPASEIPVTYAVGLLCITASARQHLPHRAIYFAEVLARLLKDREKDIDKIMMGLR